MMVAAGRRRVALCWKLNFTQKSLRRTAVASSQLWPKRQKRNWWVQLYTVCTVNGTSFFCCCLGKNVVFQHFDLSLLVVGKCLNGLLLTIILLRHSGIYVQVGRVWTSFSLFSLFTELLFMCTSTTMYLSAFERRLSNSVRFSSQIPRSGES